MEIQRFGRQKEVKRFEFSRANFYRLVLHQQGYFFNLHVLLTSLETLCACEAPVQVYVCDASLKFPFFLFASAKQKRRKEKYNSSTDSCNVNMFCAFTHTESKDTSTNRCAIFRVGSFVAVDKFVMPKPTNKSLHVDAS